MARLHEPERGIPHDEFVRRKSADRRLDVFLRARTLVPWPRWSAAVLMLLPLAAAALVGLQFGVSGALLVLGALAVGLAVVELVLVASDLLSLRDPRTRLSRMQSMAIPTSAEGPRPLFLVALAVLVFATVLVMTLLSGGSLADAVGTVLIAAAGISVSSGLGSIHRSARAALVGRLLRRPRREP